MLRKAPGRRERRLILRHHHLHLREPQTKGTNFRSAFGHRQEAYRATYHRTPLPDARRGTGRKREGASPFSRGREHVARGVRQPGRARVSPRNQLARTREHRKCCRSWDQSPSLSPPSTPIHRVSLRPPPLARKHSTITSSIRTTSPIPIL